MQVKKYKFHRVEPRGKLIFERGETIFKKSVYNVCPARLWVFECFFALNMWVFYPYFYENAEKLFEYYTFFLRLYCCCKIRSNLYWNVLTLTYEKESSCPEKEVCMNFKSDEKGFRFIWSSTGSWVPNSREIFICTLCSFGWSYSYNK